MPGLRPLACFLLLLLAGTLASAQARLPAAPTDGADDPTAIPPALRDVDVEQRIGNVVPLDAPLIDAQGDEVTLRRYFTNDAGEPVPVLLNLGYYDCPLLCIPVRRGIADAARPADEVPGEDYRIVSLSIKPEETPGVANLYKQRDLKRLQRPDAPDSAWAFLTGPESSVRPIAEAVGFGYEFQPVSGEYAHGAFITFLSPGDEDADLAPGTVTSYLNGVAYTPQQLGLALRDASTGSLGSPFEGLIAWCYQFSGEHGRYVIVARRVMALSGLIILGVLCVVLFFLFRWERARHARLRGEAEPAASA